MPLVLRPGEDADATRMAEIERTAFADNKLTPFLFPGPFPDDALEKRAEGLIAQRQNDPTTRWVKVVDTDTNTDELVAYAKWNIMDKLRDPEPGRQEFGPGCNIEMCKEYFGGIYRKRAELMGGKAYCCKLMGSHPLFVCTAYVDRFLSSYSVLDLLQTDPQYQGRGAGGMLIQFGLDMADQLRVPAYLESSPNAHGLYYRYEFRDIGQFTLNPKWNYGDADGTIYFMIRDVPEPK
ncbi:hypothetical protein H2202_010390 [Exophiala xenobiotica]|nr:hypothetical protein H2202_010390 [Exophiala xenobiotica]KAK5191991.1 hypothetical protein LTR92_007938 [Exophiala xenobiotica]KAK5205263.1 hypothetical protein LTR41_009112 [Exophiala xenobiotica]KAK5218960.1 hypothetical protein LTR72_008142 [Exophiala xenobiotica]KAK5278316.1 hypothetical protein LTR40_009309 [Exophiala xenobiotica]